MKYTLLLLLFAVMMAAPPALSAKDVTLTAPGTLAGAMGSDLGVTTLNVTGPMDASDFSFISTKLLQLQQLDLSGATIEAYKGEPLKMSKVSISPANTLPDYALSGVPLTSLTSPGSDLDRPRRPQRHLHEEHHSAAGAAEHRRRRLLAFGAHQGEHRRRCQRGLAGVQRLHGAQGGDLRSVGDCRRSLQGCTSLGKFTADALSAIGSQAFKGCTSLRRFTFSAALTEIGEGAFQASGLTSANLSQAIRLKKIGAWAFAECPGLTTFVSGPALSEIGDGAFFCDDNLEQITLSESLSAIPAYAFTNASAATEGNIMPEGTTSVGKYAYKGMSGLTEARLSNELTYLGDNAMEGMSSLRTIRAEDIRSIPALGSDVWKDVDQSQVSLNVPENLREGFRSATQWKEFHIEGPTAIAGVTADEARGVTARFDGTELVIESAEPLEGIVVALPDGKSFTRTIGEPRRPCALRPPT